MVGASGVPEILNRSFSPSPLEAIEIYGTGSALSMMQGDPFALNGIHTKTTNILNLFTQSRNNVEVKKWLWDLNSSTRQQVVWHSYLEERSAGLDEGSFNTFGMAVSKPFIEFALEIIQGVLLDNIFNVSKYMRADSQSEGNSIHVLFGIKRRQGGPEIPKGTWSENLFNADERWMVCKRPSSSSNKDVALRLQETLECIVDDHLTSDNELGLFFKYKQSSVGLKQLFSNMTSIVRTTFFKTFRESLIPSRIRFLQKIDTCLNDVPARIGGMCPCGNRV